MGEMDRFRLALGRPQHGWLPFRLEIGDFILEDSASFVLNDPLAEWLDLLECCIRPCRGPARVCLWLEPAGYAVDLVASEQAEQVELRVYFDPSFIPPMRERSMSLQFEGVVRRSTVAAGLVAGLGGLLRGDAMDSHELRCEPYLSRFDGLAFLNPG